VEEMYYIITLLVDFSNVANNKSAQIQNKFAIVLGMFKLGGNGDEKGVHAF